MTESRQKDAAESALEQLYALDREAPWTDLDTDGEPQDEERGVPQDPPNYRPATGAQNCGTCKMFTGAQQNVGTGPIRGQCWGYGMRPVDADHLCDSWSAEPDQGWVRGSTL